MCVEQRRRGEGEISCSPRKLTSRIDSGRYSLRYRRAFDDNNNNNNNNNNNDDDGDDNARKERAIGTLNDRLSIFLGFETCGEGRGGKSSRIIPR